ncbi:MAG: DUF4157 domain-containing protein [Deltaproteobacteria bacterium]|nr:DUF4157 domain-containing protein [Deltaproteobacteria bacterium]
MGIIHTPSDRSQGEARGADSAGAGRAPGRASLTGGMVQRKAGGAGAGAALGGGGIQLPEGLRGGDGGAQEAAAGGLTSAGSSLPHLGAIQQSFGRHDVSTVVAHQGEQADAACDALGARAYAFGSEVAFGADSADLHTAAHEAAHVVQQRGGVQLAGGVGQAGDIYEQHADQVADIVVQGGSAEALLDQMSPGGGTSGAVQRSVVQRDPQPAGGGGAAQAGNTDQYGILMGELAGFTEGDASLGPLELTAAFVTNDVAVPERVKFGPASEMTRVVRNDEGLMTARRAHAATGANSHYCRFGVFQFLRETSQGSLTMHMIGSYNVRMADTPDGKVLFVVENATGRQSGTRNPITGRGATPDVDRAHSEWFGTIHQRYYWIEDKYQSNLLDDALAWLGVF